MTLTIDELSAFAADERKTCGEQASSALVKWHTPRGSSAALLIYDVDVFDECGCSECGGVRPVKQYPLQWTGSAWRVVLSQ